MESFATIEDHVDTEKAVESASLSNSYLLKGRLSVDV